MNQSAIENFNLAAKSILAKTNDGNRLMNVTLGKTDGGGPMLTWELQIPGPSGVKEGASTSVPKVHREGMSKAMLDTAILDSDLFVKLERAYEATGALERLRSSLLKEDAFLLGASEQDRLQNWALMVEPSLTEPREALSALYAACNRNQH